MDSKSPRCHTQRRPHVILWPRYRGATNDVFFSFRNKKGCQIWRYMNLYFSTEIFFHMQSLQILNRFYWWFLESRNGSVQPEWWYTIPTRAHETLWPSLKAQSKGPVMQWDIVNLQRHNKRSLFDVSILYMHWWHALIDAYPFSCR